MLESLAHWFGNLFTGNDAERRSSALGDRGENVAAKYLRNQGYRILHRNFRAPKVGEVDVIARDGKTLVFVEVKTRKDTDHGVTPDDQVDQHKQHQISRVAEAFLSRYGIPQPPCRFDVVAVIWPRNQEPIIRHTVDAFSSTVVRVDPRSLRE